MPLSTSHVSETPSSIAYKARSQGFSSYVITGEESCTGVVSLTLSSSVEAEESVTSTVSGLSNCAGKTAQHADFSSTKTVIGII